MIENNNERGLILVVDDQPNNLKVISSVLSKHYTLSAADCGKRALMILEKVIPDLILLDIMMPEMDGYEVCQIIKDNERLREIPIIFLTAKNELQDMIRGFDLGAVDYITKPFNIGELKIRIQNHLNLANAKKLIIRQKVELENQNYELQQIQAELEKRNEDLIFAQVAIEQHAHNINKINQKLLESESQLIQTNIELTQAIREKDKFVSILAHDLKSPFNGLIGLLELLNESSETINEDDKTEMVSALYSSAKKVYALLENLLEWSRIQRDVVKFNPDIIYPKLLVDNILSIKKAQISLKSINVDVDIRSDSTITADEMMLNTIFRNLISNAVKFTRDSGSISISSKEIEDEFVEFCIEDNGVGMNEITMNKLFKIDQHITSIGTAKETGTGLGLILSKEFIDKHKGKIRVESEVNNGSKFFFSIPFDGKI